MPVRVFTYGYGNLQVYCVYGYGYGYQKIRVIRYLVPQAQERPTSFSILSRFLVPVRMLGSEALTVAS